MRVAASVMVWIAVFWLFLAMLGFSAGVKKRGLGTLQGRVEGRRHFDDAKVAAATALFCFVTAVLLRVWY